MIQSTLRVIPEIALMPAHPVLAALALLASAGCIVLAATAAALSFAAGHRRLAWRIAAAAAAVSSAYAATLVGFSLASRDRVLPLGARKYFCELDCHLAYSVTGLETVGIEKDSPGHARPLPRVQRVRVRVRTWFDPSTIAPFRGPAPLTPNRRESWIVDAAGRRYDPDPSVSAATPPFSQALRPGESYETALTFDLPPDARPRRLFVGDPSPENRWLIGHEESPGHGRIWFALTQ
jgi:hypothetical protein